MSVVLFLLNITVKDQTIPFMFKKVTCVKIYTYPPTLLSKEIFHNLKIYLYAV